MKKITILLLINLITLFKANSQCSPIVFPSAGTAGSRICLEGSPVAGNEICFENSSGNLNFLFNTDKKFTFQKNGSLGVGIDTPLADIHAKTCIAIGHRDTDLTQSGFRIDYVNNATTTGDRSATYFRNFRDLNYTGFTREVAVNDYKQIVGMDSSLPTGNLFYVYGATDNIKVQLSGVSTLPNFFLDSNVGIGTNIPKAKLEVVGNAIIGNIPYNKMPVGYNLYVEKGILAEKVKVAVLTNSMWSDYVFSTDYNLKPLNEVEEYIKINKHLPNIPSAEELVKDGLDIAEMQAKQMEKIEELTLYLIEMKKEIDFLKKENIELKKNSSNNKN